MAAPSREHTGFGALLTHLYWTSIGNLPIIFLPLLVFKNKAAGFSGLDIGMIGAWVALILARLVDAKIYETPKPGELKKYVGILTAVCAGLMVLGHLGAKFAG